MTQTITLQLPLWRVVVFCIAFASFFVILGFVASKWKYLKLLKEKFKAGDLLIDCEITDITEPNTYLKLTKPLDEIVSKPIAVFEVRQLKKK